MAKHGRFYFKQTASGNLIGEYSNEHSTENVTESCNIIGEKLNEKFIGEYQSIWFEDADKEPYTVTLKITHKQSPINNIFSLSWESHTNKQFHTFKGEGFIVDDILIGTYWSV